MATHLIPHLNCRRAAEAVEFYQKAFGATAAVLQKLPDGRVMHAALAIDGAPFYVVDEFPEHKALSPEALGGTPVTLHLEVTDSDAVYNRAVEAGCTVVWPIQDMFWGARYGIVADPYGHKWGIATPKREVNQEEINKAMKDFK